MPAVEDPTDPAIAPATALEDPEGTIGETVDTPFIGIIGVPVIELIDGDVAAGASRAWVIV
jgi:hypothetical protein